MKRVCLLMLSLGLIAMPAIPGHEAAAQEPPPSAAAENEAGTAFRIAGIVLDAVNAAPVAGAQVSITVDGSAVEVTAGSDGRFVFGGLKVGKYSLFAWARGYAQEGYNQHGAFLTAVAVRSGLDSEHVVFRLHPEAVLYGKVTDERGEAVRRAQVMLLSGDQGWGQRRVGIRSQTQTNDLGGYRFAHLRAGRYYVAVQTHPWYAQTGLKYLPESEPLANLRSNLSSLPQGTAPDPMLDVVYPVTFYPGVTDGNAAGVIELNSGESEEADIALQAVPSVHMLIPNLPVDEKNRTFYDFSARANVLGTIEFDIPFMVGESTSGEFEIAGLPPEKVTLELYRSAGQATESRSLEVYATDGATVDARGAGTTVTVSGQVVFPAGVSAMMGGQVVLTDEASVNIGTQLEKDGTFAFPVVGSGTYRVMVSVQGQELYTSRVVASGAKTNGRKLSIDGAENVKLTITMGRGLGRLMGFAIQDGKPTAGVMVILVPESKQDLDENTRIDQSDSDGTFTLSNIIPGKYVLMAIADGWDLEWARPEVLEAYWAKGQVVQIGPKESKEVTLEVQKKATAAERQ